MRGYGGEKAFGIGATHGNVRAVIDQVSMTGAVAM
jgi:hypothetical protein